MALQEMEIVIAAVVRTYDFRLAEDCHVKEVLEITLKPRYAHLHFVRPVQGICLIIFKTLTSRYYTSRGRTQGHVDVLLTPVTLYLRDTFLFVFLCFSRVTNDAGGR
jgi:hypothetical protein